jgi:integrase
MPPRNDASPGRGSECGRPDSDIAGSVQARLPETRRSRRTIPLSRSCVDALKVHRRRQAAERLALGPAWTDTGLVFTTSVAKAIEPRNVSRSFEQLCDRAKLRRIRLHDDPRHMYATLLLAEYVPAPVVMEILGHSQIAVTMNPTPTSRRSRTGMSRRPLAPAFHGDRMC